MSQFKLEPNFLLPYGFMTNFFVCLSILERNLSPLVPVSQQWSLMALILQRYVKQDLLRIMEEK